jgi:acylglycerol lipase
MHHRPSRAAFPEKSMRKSVIALAIIAGVIATAAAIATVAVQRGRAPVTGACPGALPTGPFTAYRTVGADGNCLQGYHWAPPAAARAVVVVVHGLGDHARRYEGLARELNAVGVAVVAQDHRGHAGSGGARQRLDSIDQLLADVELALQEAARRHPGVPVFLHGHSLGGLVVTQYAARKGQGLAGVVVSSAALKRPTTASDGQVRVVSTLSAVAPNLGLEALDPAKIVREPMARAALLDDPDIQRAKLPARTVSTLLAGVDDLQSRMPAVTRPLLILHGQADTVTDPMGSRWLLERAGSTDKALKQYGPALHDLLHEPEAGAVRREIVAFVTSRAAPAK